MRKYLIYALGVLFLFIPKEVFAESVTVNQPGAFTQVFQDSVGGLAGGPWSKSSTSIPGTYWTYPVYELPYIPIDSGNVNAWYFRKDYGVGSGASFYTYSFINEFAWWDWNNYCGGNDNVDVVFEVYNPSAFDWHNFAPTFMLRSIVNGTSTSYTCSYEYIDNYRLSVKCNYPYSSGISATSLLIYSNLGRYSTAPAVNSPIAINRVVNFTCNMSNSSVIANQNQNKQDIIDNQNQNMQTIIENQNQNQAQTNEKLDDLNSSITDSSVPDVGGAFGGINTNQKDISDLVLLPINVLKKYTDFTNKECAPYEIQFGIFGNPYTLTLPCIDLKKYLGSELMTLIDSLSVFFFIYEFVMLVINAFDSITELRDTYEGLYQPKHSGYKPKHGGD